MTPELRSALDNAYIVFADYKEPLGLAARCHVPRYVHQLTRTDWNLMDSQFDMWLQIYSDFDDTFRHYLPRLLEWMCDFEGGGLNHDLDFPLVKAKWRKWPVQEVEAVRAVLRAWVTELLSRADGDMPLSFILEVEVEDEDELAPYLDVWLRHRPAEVARWITFQSWTRPHPNVLSWTLQAPVEEVLETTFWIAPDGPDAPLLSRSLQIIHALRASNADSS